MRTVHVALKWESIVRFSVVVCVYNIFELNAGLQEQYVQPAAHAGMLEHVPVDTAGDTEVRKRAPIDIRFI